MRALHSTLIHLYLLDYTLIYIVFIRLDPYN